MKNNGYKKGKQYWRSLDQLAETPEYKDFLQREFPKGASENDNAWSRRKFLTLMGASMAMAGLASCRRPVEKIVPYVNRPEDLVPGIPEYYATSMPFGDHALGLLVESHEGRPSKIEGNKLHPSTGGASNSYMQAETYALFDTDRSQKVMNNGEKSTVDEFKRAWKTLHDKFKQNGGSGLAVLSGAFSSPTMSRLYNAFKRTFPNARWVTYEPVSDENIYNGHRIAFNKWVRPVYSFDKADVILSLDSDFLNTESNGISNARHFAAGRKVESEKDSMNRLYVVESGFSVTGTNADHRQAVKPSETGAYALALARELNSQGINIGGLNNLSGQNTSDFNFKWVKELAADLIRTRGKSLVIAGRKQPPTVHALVAAMNEALGNNGQTVNYISPVDATFSSSQDLKDLAIDLNSGKIDTLVMLGTNPVYTSPADLEFSAALGKASNTIQLSHYVDETARRSSWHIPRSHFLEYWGDARSYDGTASVIQPLIRPLFDSLSDLEMLSLLVDGTAGNGYEMVRRTWQNIIPTGDFESKWRRVVHDGLLAGSSSKTTPPSLSTRTVVDSIDRYPLVKKNKDIEIVFQSSPNLLDGRYSGIGWLQELPHPITKLTWDNAALISKATADRMSVKNSDVIKIDFNGRSLESPVWIQPGQSNDTVVLELGYGRENVSNISNGVGSNVYVLRTSDAINLGIGATLSKTSRTHALACTQDHWSMEGRPLIREATLEEYRKDPKFAQEMVEHPPLESMFTEPSYEEGYQWGMTVDLNSCVGCNACTIACQSENNIATVGKEQVINGREMHWIRVDRYFNGEVDTPEAVHQPVLCMHCENAPCEQVCPVAATTHSSEGLNLMIYNRCIGTRYCSNNCPYKVRRFNFFNYTKDYDELKKMTQNPDVTVRSRGVMEKCTYCVQRITAAKKSAKKEKRLVKDGEIIPACQQACPAEALTFGNVNDPSSEVSRKKKFNRNYDMLEELNVQPRTSYLAKLRNPNPEIETA
jgi:MoCo/4Fe-4S cofactor protein with predicted Tat translocation signal